MEDRAKKLADLKKLTLENQKLIEETLTLTRKTQNSLEVNAELQLAKLQADNHKLSEEVLTVMKRNNILLEMQSELYEKVIEAKKSKESIPKTESKKIQKVKSEKDHSFEDLRE